MDLENCRKRWLIILLLSAFYCYTQRRRESEREPVIVDPAEPFKDIIAAIRHVIGNITSIRFIRSDRWIVYPNDDPFQGIVIDMTAEFEEIIKLISEKIGKVIRAFSINPETSSIFNLV